MLANVKNKKAAARCDGLSPDTTQRNGRGGIRTPEGFRQQIYSLPRLATPALARDSTFRLPFVWKGSLRSQSEGGNRLGHLVVDWAFATENQARELVLIRNGKGRKAGDRD